MWPSCAPNPHCWSHPLWPVYQAPEHPDSTSFMWLYLLWYTLQLLIGLLVSWKTREEEEGAFILGFVTKKASWLTLHFEPAISIVKVEDWLQKIGLQACIIKNKQQNNPKFPPENCDVFQWSTKWVCICSHTHGMSTILSLTVLYSAMLSKLQECYGGVAVASLCRPGNMEFESLCHCSEVTLPAVES